MSNEDLLFFEEPSYPPKRVSPPSSAFSLSLLDGPLDFLESDRPASGHLLLLDPIPNLTAPILQPTPAPSPVTPSTVILGVPIPLRKEEPRRPRSVLDSVHSILETPLSVIAPSVSLEPISSPPSVPSPLKPTNASSTLIPIPPTALEQIPLIDVPKPMLLAPDVSPTSNSPGVDTPKAQEDPELIPRSYQLEIYEKALNENLIAVMDTGSGKTLVAAMLIKEMIRREKEANKTPTERKLCIFVVNNVPLVKQQAGVIRAQSRAEVVELCGASKTKKLEETLWDDISESTYVVVLTAQILLDVLRHGYWHMHRINLLVFDECHHARKDHPFCFIMNEFYHNKRALSLAQKPRVFGMTASPTSDIGSKMDQSASDLERVLDSKVFYVKPHQLEEFVEKPMQIVALYNPPPKYNPTRLTLRMRRACGFEPKLLQTLNDVSTNLSQLGPWCVDHIWDLAVRNLRTTTKSTTSSEHLATVHRIMKDMSFLPPICNDENLTPKVQKLIQILRVTRKALKDEFCGIIFVQRRDTAAALTILLQELEEFHDLLRVEVLAGHSEGNHALLNMTLKEQDAIITKFRNKELNLLVSTSVAEEGLDIQPCNIVIRFDPVTTTTSYMQSRGRARKKNSRYIMMQERDNHKEEASLEKIQYGEQSMREWYSNRPNKPAGEDDQIQDKLTPEQQYHVPSTQALLTLGSAVPLLHKYCASLSTDEYCDWKPEFDVSASGTSGFLCDLTLPPAAPVHYFQSDRTSTMDMARKSAAFKACEALHKLGAIDDHLDPVIKKVRSNYDEGESTNQHKANQNKSYPRNTPLFWNHDLSIVQPQTLFACTVFYAKDTHYHRHSYRTMCILTKQPLPFLEHSLNVFVKGKARQVIMRTSSHLEFNQDQIALLRQFTLVLFQRMCKKDFDCEPDRMPYYVAPLTAGDIKISWDDVQMGQSTAVAPLDDRLSEEAILDLVVMVKNDDTGNYFVYDILRSYRMSDKMPSNKFKMEVESYSAQGTTSLGPTFGDYFKWKFKLDCAEDETILLVQRVKRMRNHLQPAPIEEKEQDDGALKLVPLSACRKSSVRASVLRVSQVIPSALFDLDSFLLVQEAQERVGLRDIRIDLLQMALTTSSANREYHYERLELLGDSFLKFSSTIRLFIVNPVKNEGQLHLSRIRIISNSALLKHSAHLELYRYISSTPFHRKHWRPIHFTVDGKPWDNQQQHMLSNKTMADVIEAALGAAFLSGGSIVAFHAAKLLRVPFDEFETWKDFARVYHESSTPHIDSNSTSSASIPPFGSEQQRHIDKVQKFLGYSFKNPRLFMEAMTHASSARMDSSCYERLEFLGDAVLDFQVVKYYYHKYRNAPPGAITLIKDASVNNQILGALAIQWGLGEFLIHNSEPLASEIQRTIATLEMQKESSPTNTLEGEYWVNIKMPKVLGDLVESTLGAVFVDCGFDFVTICDVFDRLIRPFLDNHISLEQIVIHPTKALIEFVQSKGCNEAKFQREEMEVENRSKNTMRKLGLGRCSGRDANPTQVCKFMVHGQLIATATGLDIGALRKQVAEEAMRKLQADPDLVDAKCNCPKRRRARHATMLDKYQEGRFANGLPVSLLD